ncbi:hypothetical protein KSP24_00810 [Paenibacillus sp. AK121]|uniref:contractile injection system protein, VgrG/Pvc8 family n=1 Tax=Paenibacillus sp. AK121 TaxID=2849670 RepID=UPI001C239089|nr:contractile injection system protein, VgrG/Pvc8 family [Paenibacillus sp. AK121]MBU9705467.1 hypothetical protein [Paenibacillus sp. AK121]
MSVLSDGIGYESLRFYGPFQPLHIDQLQITRTINDHAFLHISGMLSEEQGAVCIGQDMEQEPIVIRQLDDQGQSLRRLFHGIVTRMSVRCVRGVYTFELEAASHSYQMDIKRKRRSYQDIHRTYDDLVTALVRKYQYGDAIDTVSHYAKLETFVLQYDETDWAFLKRLASRFGSILVPEVTAASPKVFFGMPEGKQHKVERDVFYRVRKTFHERDAEKPRERAGSYITYMIESLQYYALGDLITLPIGQDKELVVVRAVTTLADGLLRTRYDLQAEQDICYARYENDRATGIALTGTVLKVQQDFVQLQLDIDPKQDPAKSCWFPVSTRYVAEEHSGWYDMPEIGEQVELYLPTHREQDAYVTDSLRQQRHTNGQLNVKVWQHVQGSGVEMSEHELNLSTSGEFSITLHESNGITIDSPGNVQIQGGHVKLDAGQELSLEAGMALYLKGGASSMVLDGETDTKAPVIYQEGTVKAPVFVADLPPVPEPPLMSIKAYEAAQTPSAAKTSSSSTPTAKVTSPAAHQQANSLLGTVSKLLGSIPVMGKVAGVVAGALSGPAGGVILKATAAIPVRSKGTPTVGGSKGNGIHPLKHLAGLAMQGLISIHEHEKAKQAYYNKWILGKVYTSARHIVNSGGTLELVQNLLKESNAMFHAYQQVPEDIRKRWRANYDSRLAQQQPKQQVEKPKSWWDRYLEYTGSSAMIKSQIAMEQAHTAQNVTAKSADSLTEIGTGIYEANMERIQKRYDSVGAYLDYLSYGIPKGIYQAYMERARNQGNSGSDAINFATFGITETIRGALTPKDPLSAEHWSNIIGLVGIIEGTGSFFKPKPTLKSPVKEPIHAGPKIINGKTEPPQSPNLKLNKGKEIGGTGGSGATFEGKTGRDYSRFAINDPSPPNVKNAEDYFKMTRDGDAVEPHEWGLIFDKNGNPISKLITDYHPGKIDVSKYKALSKDGVYTHNHPNNGVFSWQDLETARGFDMAEIRATLPNGTTLSIERGPNGWNWENMDTQITLNKAKQNVLTKPEYAELLRQRDQAALDMAWMKEFAELMGGSFNVYK